MIALTTAPLMPRIQLPLEPTRRARAAREGRSLSYLIEVLILDYGRPPQRRLGLRVPR